jgi:hypothetical protein
MTNLLPTFQKKSIRALYRKRFFALVFLSVAALAIAAILLALPSFLFLKSSEIVLVAKRDTLAAYETSTIARTLASAVADVNSRLAVFPSSETASPLIADFMNPVLLAKTKAIHLIGFSYEKGTKPNTASVKITGTADSRVALLSFADKLKKVGSFSDVNVPIANFIKDSDVPFTITATVSLK